MFWMSLYENITTPQFTHAVNRSRTLYRSGKRHYFTSTARQNLMISMYNILLANLKYIWDTQKTWYDHTSQSSHVCSVSRNINNDKGQMCEICERSVAIAHIVTSALQLGVKCFTSIRYQSTPNN